MHRFAPRVPDELFDQFSTDPTCDYIEHDWNEFVTNPIFVLGSLFYNLSWHREDRQEDYYCYNTDAACRNEYHDILNCPNFQSGRNADTAIPMINTKIREVESVLSTLIKEHFANNFGEGVETFAIGIKRAHGYGLILKAHVHTSKIGFTACGSQIKEMLEADCLAFDLSPYMRNG
jgi:hypothetical protein